MRQIPRGKVTTYKILAEKLWTWPRVVWRICGANPDIALLSYKKALENTSSSWMSPAPCHRVVRSDGKVDGYAHGTEIKIELLREEWIPLDENNKIRDLWAYLYRF
jgi:methylated-DNA-[protein]-cysteine S-methyltransferase